MLMGTEDHEINCVKYGGIATDARPAISEVTCRLMDENGSDSETDHLHRPMKTKVNFRRTKSFLKVTVRFLLAISVTAYHLVHSYKQLRQLTKKELPV